jgi:hypothetical protein
MFLEGTLRRDYVSSTSQAFVGAFAPNHFVGIVARFHRVGSKILLSDGIARLFGSVNG